MKERLQPFWHREMRFVALQDLRNFPSLSQAEPCSEKKQQMMKKHLHSYALRLVGFGATCGGLRPDQILLRFLPPLAPLRRVLSGRKLV